ncbi:MAG TPA: LytTR family DNA-binding domain-containing protein [Catalimonadaceae bacterium]|nr:LytTR family DNA-binding domain-containing protein [Catalimonadaceae bacterium]
MKAYLIDDEPANSVVLWELLKEYFPFVEVLGTATNVLSAWNDLKSLKPDVIFLDVRMPDYSGFEFLDQLERTDVEIVFVTGYEEFALKAIKREAADYLLKPIDVDELKAALERVEKRLLQKQPTDLGTEEIQVQVHQREKVIVVSSSKILWIEADGNYTVLGMEDGERHTLPRTLKELEIQLEAIQSFIRIHRSLIVNLSHLISYSKTDPCLLKLKGGHEFEISRRKKTEVLARLGKSNL